MTHRSASAWHGAVIVVTGIVPGMTRQQAKTRIIGHGAQLGGSVTGRTTCLVWDGRQASRKLREAVHRGTPIMTAQEFAQLADETYPPPLPTHTSPDTMDRARRLTATAGQQLTMLPR